MTRFLRRSCRALTLFFFGLFSLVSMLPPAVASVGDLLVVSVDGGRLRSAPTSNSNVLKSLKKGQVLKELLRKNNWVMVKLLDKELKGWIFKTNIKLASQTNNKLNVVKKKNNESVVQQLNLSQLGYKKGILFEGSSNNHARKLYFQVPQDVSLWEGRFRIHYQYSPLLDDHSNLRVYVNGSPRKITRLGSNSNSGWLDIKLNKADLGKRYILVELKSAMLISKDRCFDERVSGAYLQILPDSNLQWSLQGDVDSIRGYWRMLPKQVKISLPKGPLSEDLFRHALGVTQQLLASGHQPVYTRLPNMGDVVIAPAEDISEWLQQSYKNLSISGTEQLSNNKNIALLKAPDRQIVAIWGDHDKQTLNFLSDDWRDLAASKEYQVYTGNVSGLLAEDSYAIKLQDLGMDTGVIEMADSAAWSINIKPSQLPPGHRLNKIRLQLITAPSTTNNPVMFYVYLNGVLLKAVRMANSGENEEIMLALPKEEMERNNNLHFVAKRDLSEDETQCTNKPSQFPIQIKPHSTIETIVDAESSPEQFSQLPAYLSKGYDTYLPQAYMQKAETVIPYLASMMIDMDLPLMAERLRFYNPDDEIKSLVPFIFVGKTATSFDKQAVRFDKGRINIVSKQGNVLLSIDELPKISVAQIVRSGNMHGLWLLPPEGGALAPIKEMYLSKDDVAFADENGILMTLDSTQPGLARMEYPESTGWFELFGEYRFWYFAIGWLLLTSLIVYLYRLSRSHRKN